MSEWSNEKLWDYHRYLCTKSELGGSRSSKWKESLHAVTTELKRRGQL